MSRRTSYNLQGYRGSLTTDGVLQAARKALAGGVPPEAERYQSWAVEVDGQWVRKLARICGMKAAEQT